MKVAVLCLLFLAAAFASKSGVQPSIDSDSGFTLSEIQQIEELRNSKWGNIYLTMAELQVQVGPIERLIQALDDTLKELTQSLNNENNRFVQKKAAHEAQVTSLKNQISAAEADINSNKAKINNVLIPRKKQAEVDIVNAQKTIGKKKNDIVSEGKKRAVEHAAFEKKVQDHTAAIAAVDECLGLMGTLQKKPSLVEIQKATISIRKLEQQIHRTHFTETPLVEALITLVTSQNFANQESINKVLKMLGEFRKKLVGSLDLERKGEAQAQSDYEKLIVQLNKEIDQLQKNIVRNTNLISETQRAIDDCNNQIMIKTHEILVLKDKLSTENETWRKEVIVHKELVAEINKELNVIKDCKTLFAKANFGSYAKKKMGK